MNDSNAFAESAEEFADKAEKSATAAAQRLEEFKNTTDQEYDPESQNPQSGIAMAQALAGVQLKGTASGNGNVEINDVSPVKHTVLISTNEPTQSDVCVSDNKYKFASFTLSPTDYSRTVSVQIPDGKKATFSWRGNDFYMAEATVKTGSMKSLTQLEDDTTGRRYVVADPTEFGEEIIRLHFIQPSYEMTVTECSLRYDDVIEYEPYETAKANDYEIDDISVTVKDENGQITETVRFDENKTLVASSVFPTMKITASNTNVPLNVEYQRDVAKTIINLENALGTVNDTLSALVDVEE
jgi:hypothetical protein